MVGSPEGGNRSGRSALVPIIFDPGLVGLVRQLGLGGQVVRMGALRVRLLEVVRRAAGEVTGGGRRRTGQGAKRIRARGGRPPSPPETKYGPARIFYELLII